MRLLLKHSAAADDHGMLQYRRVILKCKYCCCLFCFCILHFLSQSEMACGQARWVDLRLFGVSLKFLHWKSCSYELHQQKSEGAAVHVGSIDRGLLRAFRSLSDTKLEANWFFCINFSIRILVDDHEGWCPPPHAPSPHPPNEINKSTNAFQALGPSRGCIRACAQRRVWCA